VFVVVVGSAKRERARGKEGFLGLILQGIETESEWLTPKSYA
jgi:hypothetical protein